MIPIGDWFIGNDGKWVYDANAPAAGVEETQIRPVPDDGPPLAAVYEREDGAVYGRVEPTWFDSYDKVDSRSIVDDGGPPDAA